MKNATFWLHQKFTFNRNCSNKRMLTTHLNCILIVPHIDECKSPRPPRLVIIDNLDLIDRAVMFKHLTQITLLGVQAQSKHSEAAARLRILLQKNHTGYKVQQ